MGKNNRRAAALLSAALLCASCATADMEKRVKAGAKARLKTGEPPVLVVPVEMPPPEVQVVEVEKPVYVPEPVPAPAAKQAQGRAAVEAANTAGIVKPSEYSRAAMVYDYNRDWVYEVYAQPLRVCDIRLEPGEKAAEAPFVSDSERWMLGAGVSYENGEAARHIYLKPVERGLEASLIINTDRRTYHLVLRSYTDIFMPIVRWRYPSSGMPENYAAPAGGAAESAGGPPGTAETPGTDQGVDPRFLSFNYRVIYGLFQKPKWLPELVYDDGLFSQKVFDKASRTTFLTFPENAVIFLFYTYPAYREICAVRNAAAGKMILPPGLSRKVTQLFAVRASAVDKLRRAIAFLNRHFGGAYSWDDGFYIRLFFLVSQRGPLNYPALRKLAETGRDREQAGPV